MSEDAPPRVLSYAPPKADAPLDRAVRRCRGLALTAVIALIGVSSVLLGLRMNPKAADAAALWCVFCSIVCGWIAFLSGSTGLLYGLRTLLLNRVKAWPRVKYWIALNAAVLGFIAWLIWG